MANDLITKATYNKRAIQLRPDGNVDPDKLTRELGNIEQALRGPTSLTATVYNILDYANVDPRGRRDSTDGINAAIREAYRNGGGRVLVPPTSQYYRITNNIQLLDNVELFGGGYASHIRSFATTGYSRNPIVTGNIGDVTGGGGFYNNTQYDLDTITAGTAVATFITAADAETFEVGDVVGIQSYETWPLPFPDNHGKYINLNEVVAKDGGTLTLKYTIPDEYPSAGGARPTIARLDGTGTSYDGDPEWVSKNTIIRNLRVTQIVGGPSYWYGIFLDGVNHLVENVWMDDVSTLFGSNALGYSTVRNVIGRYDGGALDFADFQCNNLIEDVQATRVGRRGNVIGISVNNGADVTLRNVFATMGWYDDATATFYKSGRATAYLVHRAKYEGCTIMNADGTTGAACALLAGFGNDVELERNKIINSSGYGIILAGGPRASVHHNTVLGTPSGNAIFALTAADEYAVWNNILGEEGSRTSVDTVAQSGGFSTNAYVSGNIQYLSKGVSTATTTYAVLATDTLVLGNATGGAFEVDLPSAVQLSEHILTVKKVDGSANAVTVDALGAETIDGAANYPLAAQYDAVTVQSDGTNWHVIASYP